MPTLPVVDCLRCASPIIDPDFRVILYQEDYPEIEIGPYCETCYGYIKICSGCQKPTDSAHTTHDGEGNHYCPTCIQSISRCSHCGKRMSEEMLEMVEGRKICSSCKSRLYFTCNCCGELHATHSEVNKNSLEGRRRAGVFRKYKRICEDCFEKKHRFFKFYDIRECQHCESIYAYTEGCDHTHYCSNCWNNFHTCNRCNHKGPDVQAEKVDGSTSTWCMSCYSAHVVDCPTCGKKTTHVSEIIRGLKKIKVCAGCVEKKKTCSVCGELHASLSDGVCQNCKKLYKDNICTECGRVRDSKGSCRVCNNATIYSYSTKPSLYLNYTKKELIPGSVFFGFENELSFNNNKHSSQALKKLYEAFDPTVVIAKSDGSIPNYGFEVVTQPMTLDYFNSMDLSTIVPTTAADTTDCGLHIHVSRRAFLSDLHIYKVINFMNSNRKFAEYIAGRTFNGYAAAVRKKVTEFVKDGKNGRSDRRTIVNLLNKHTVEFRLYKGCLNEQELRMRVEFTLGLIEFCKTSKLTEGTVENLKEFFASKKKMYPNAFVAVSVYSI